MSHYRKAISLIIKKDEKYLLVNTKGWDKDIWCFIQGGIEEDEEEIDAINREIKEEIGDVKIKIIKKSPIIHQYRFSKEQQQKKGHIGQIQTIWFLELLDDFNDVDISSFGELQQYKWVSKEEILDYFKFPEQKETFRRVLEHE